MREYIAAYYRSSCNSLVCGRNSRSIEEGLRERNLHKRGQPYRGELM